MAEEELGSFEFGRTIGYFSYCVLVDSEKINKQAQQLVTIDQIAEFAITKAVEKWSEELPNIDPVLARDGLLDYLEQDTLKDAQDWMTVFPRV